MKIRKSNERGYFDHGWLKSFHSYSFADYYDPNFVHLKSLRVLNEDFIDEATGFPTHPHREMEIVTYVIKGSINHHDSMGNHFIINAGETQRMTAGRGITHSESNPGKEKLHLLQIWFLPNKAQLTPEYEQKSFLQSKGLTLIGTPKNDKNQDALQLNANVFMWSGRFDKDAEVEIPVKSGSGVYLHLIEGSVQEKGGSWITAGDALWEESLKAPLSLNIKGNSHFVVFELL